MRARITGTGSYAPERVMTNADIERMVATSDEWIRERTGIRERRVVADGQACSDLALIAAERALKAAGVSASELDLIVQATCTGDTPLPSTACLLQHRLGASRAAAFDLAAACCGFVYALGVADAYVRTGMRHVLVVGSEVMSAITDWTDRNTCVLFGDGAGAVVLQAYEGKGDNSDSGILNTKLFSDGLLHDLLYADGGVSSTQTVGKLRMQGKEVFRHAVTNIAEAIQASADAAGIPVADIDWFVPHQANQRILDGTAKKLGIPPEKVISTVAVHGNTSAASVPLALEVAVRDGRVKKGDLVLMEALGGGLTWGAALLRL